VSVHDKHLYAGIKQDLGIPLEEPIFILRAQDKQALPVLKLYLLNNLAGPGTEQWAEEMANCIEDFDRYADTHPDRMKEPD